MITIRSTKDEKILDFIHQQVFAHRGSEFHFTIAFEEKWVYTGGPFFDHYTEWKNSEKCNSAALKATLPQGIAITETGKNILLRKSGFTEEKGKTYECFVSSSFSWDYFQKVFAHEGDIFFVHLMEHKIDLVKKLLKFFISEKNFTIEKIGILVFVPYDSDTLIRFRDFNIAPLNNIAECYGLACAFAEIIKNSPYEFEGYSFNSMSYHPGGGISREGISVCFDYIDKHEKPKLESW